MPGCSESLPGFGMSTTDVVFHSVGNVCAYRSSFIGPKNNSPCTAAFVAFGSIPSDPGDFLRFIPATASSISLAVNIST